MPTSEVDIALARLSGDPSAGVLGSEQRTVAFVGGSPGWGDSVASAELAVPALLERLAARTGRPLRVANLTCNGQLVADSYFLAKAAAARGADLAIVQVTYHNFSPAGRDGDRQRFPELPALLGVPVTRSIARTLSTEPTPRPDVTGAMDRWLRARWRLYRSRDRLASHLLGASPERWLRDRWDRLLRAGPVGAEATSGEGPQDDGDDAAFAAASDGGSATSWADLDPGLQSMMADEWATDASFQLSSRDSEGAMLRALCEELEGGGVDVLVYLAPLNLTGLTDMGMLDEAALERNVSVLEGIVESSGAEFIDLNEPTPLPSGSFADISHTTYDGCLVTAQRLIDEEGPLLFAGPRTTSAARGRRTGEGR